MKDIWQHTDDILIRKFKNGDKEAFSAVYEKFHDHMFYFAYRLIRDRDEAADIMVVAMEELLRRHKNFETINNIKNFLYITVRNKSFKYLEKQKKVKASQKELFIELNEKEDTYILTHIIEAEFLQQIYQEIESLPPKQKSVLQLLYIEGLSFSEISKRLDMSPETVRVNKFQALKQLRSALISKKILLLLAGFVKM